MSQKSKRNGADIMVINGVWEDTRPVQLTKPILDHYVSIPDPTPTDHSNRTSYHLRTNISKHDLTTRRFFKTAAQTYAFIRRNGHPITSCSTSYGCPGRIQ